MHPYYTIARTELYARLSVHVSVCSPLSGGVRGRMRAREVNAPPPLSDGQASDERKLCII